MSQKESKKHFNLFLFYLFLLVCGMMITFSARSKQHLQKQDLLTEIRKWGVEYGGYSSKQLLGVRLLKEDTLKDKLIKYYQIAPCTSLCGEIPECAQLCQRKISDWKENLAFSKLMVEAYMEDKLIGRIGLQMNDHLSLVAWPSPNLFALLQEDSENYQLILIQIPPQSKKNQTQINLQNLNETEDEPPIQQMRIVAQLDLGSFKKFSFDDLDGDQQIDILAPEPIFARLNPKPIYVEMVYRFEKGILRAAPSLLRGEIPAKDKLREYLLKINPQQNPDLLFSNAIRLAFQGYLPLADELVAMSYSQDPTKLAYWNQLKIYLKQSEYWIEPKSQIQNQAIDLPTSTDQSKTEEMNTGMNTGMKKNKKENKSKKPAIIVPID